MKVYILNFLVYTMAMVGVIYLSLMIFKRTMTQNSSNSNNNLKIEASLNIAPRKTLHVVNINGEKFLIASDVQTTTFLSKLEENKINTDINKLTNIEQEDKMFLEELNNLRKSRQTQKHNHISILDEIIEKENEKIDKVAKENDKSVFRELIQKL